MRSYIVIQAQRVMNISYNWLRQYIDCKLTPSELAGALTSIGLETGTVEEVESIKGGLKGLVIGKVLTCVEHPDSDHLHVTTVDLGQGEPVQIVCGAPNVAAGQTVVVATIGTTLYDGDKEFKIKKSKMRGVESLGMICAEDEIGVGTSHDGIIVIEEDIKPGTPAADYFGLTSDYVLEVDLTPNRIDAASHFGVARDLSAWMACHAEPAQLKRPDVESFHVDNPAGDAIKVQVDNYEAAPRFCGINPRRKGGRKPRMAQKKSYSHRSAPHQQYRGHNQLYTPRYRSASPLLRPQHHRRRSDSGAQLSGRHSVRDS